MTSHIQDKLARLQTLRACDVLVSPHLGLQFPINSTLVLVKILKSINYEMKLRRNLAVYLPRSRCSVFLFTCSVYSLLCLLHIAAFKRCSTCSYIRQVNGMNTGEYNNFTSLCVCGYASVCAKNDSSWRCSNTVKATEFSFDKHVPGDTPDIKHVPGDTPDITPYKFSEKRRVGR